MRKVFEEGRFYDTVTVGERGQVVIPAQARKDMNIKPGDRLLVIKGLGHGALVMINTKQMSKIFDKMVEHIGRIKARIGK